MSIIIVLKCYFQGVQHDHTINKISNQGDLDDLRFIFVFNLYFIVFINVFLQSKVIVYSNSQKVMIFKICDSKSEEPSERLDFVSDPSAFLYTVRVGYALSRDTT